MQRQLSWARASSAVLLQVRCRQGCLLLTDTAPRGSIRLGSRATHIGISVAQAPVPQHSRPLRLQVRCLLRLLPRCTLPHLLHLHLLPLRLALASRLAATPARCHCPLCWAMQLVKQLPARVDQVCIKLLQQVCSGQEGLPGGAGQQGRVLVGAQERGGALAVQLLVVCLRV